MVVTVGGVGGMKEGGHSGWCRRHEGGWSQWVV